MCRRNSGRLGRGGGPAPPRGTTLFFPEPQVLQKGEGELAQEGVVVQATPRAALEVVQAQLLLELLVRLLAHPAGLDPRHENLERRVGRVVREMVLSLPRVAVLTHEPDLLTGQVLGASHDGAIGDPHSNRRERSLERTLGASPPGDGAERLRPRL